MYSFYSLTTNNYEWIACNSQKSSHAKVRRNENVINRKEVKIELRDGKKYTIKPLTLNELIDIWPIIQKLEKSQSEVNIDLLEDMIKLTYKALRGQVKKEDVGDLVDLVDLKVIIGAVVGQNSETLEAMVK